MAAAASDAPRFADLVIDASELVVAFLGAGAGAVALARTCREWHAHVARSDVWIGPLASHAPITASRMKRTLASHWAAGEYSFTLDWLGAYARTTTSPQDQVTNFDVASQHNERTHRAQKHVGKKKTGGFFSAMMSKLSMTRHRRAGGDERRVVMVGLEQCGKTTVLYKLKLGEVVTTIPTMGYNVETVQIGADHSATVWDIGGDRSLRGAWPHYWDGGAGDSCRRLVWVVDAADPERFPEAKEELHTLLRSAAKPDGCVLLVLANNMAWKGLAEHPAMSCEAVAVALGLADSDGQPSAGVRHPWCVHGCDAMSGLGLLEGFTWLMDADDAPRSDFVEPGAIAMAAAHPRNV